MTGRPDKALGFLNPSHQIGDAHGLGLHWRPQRSNLDDERCVLGYPDSSARVDRDAAEGIIQRSVRQVLCDTAERVHGAP